MLIHFPKQKFPNHKFNQVIGVSIGRYHSINATASCENLIIGGGIVGMAISRYLARSTQQHHVDADFSVLLIEKNKYYADETSSRNSEVVHSGIYYPSGTQKSELCIRGSNLLLDWFCPRYKIPVERIGKWIVGNAKEPFDISYLKKLLDRANSVGIPAEILGHEQIKNTLNDQILSRPMPSDKLRTIYKQEPLLRKPSKEFYPLIVNSPRTAKVNSYRLLVELESQAINAGAQHMKRSEVFKIERVNDSSSKESNYMVWIREKGKNRVSEYSVLARNVINAAGLWADDIAAQVIDKQSGFKLPEAALKQYRIYPCKGRYYTLPNWKLPKSKSSSGKNLINRLIYPVPPDPQSLKGLGIHCTPEFQSNRIRLGPDTAFAASKTDYSIDIDGDKEIAVRKAFYDSIKRYLDVDMNYFEHMMVDYAGLRPKLSPLDAPVFKDFIIQEETKAGFPGFINLIGIESPGLTCCLSIAELVEKTLYKKVK